MIANSTGSLLDDPMHAGVQRAGRAISTAFIRRARAASARCGAERVSMAGRRRSLEFGVCVSALRRKPSAPVLVVCNMTPVPRPGYRIGVPLAGGWREIFNSDSALYGGSNVGNAGRVDAHCHASARPAAIARTRIAAARHNFFEARRMIDGINSRATRSAVRHIRSARPGTASAPISRSSPRMPSASSSACSIHPGGARLRASTLPECTDEVWHGYLPNARAGLDLRLSRVRAIPPAGRASLQSTQATARSLCARASPAPCGGRTRYSAIASIRRAAICHSIGATARRACRKRLSATTPSTGAMIARPTCRGQTQSSTKRMCAACTMLRDDIRPNERGTFAALADRERDQSSASARHHRDRAFADPRLRAGPRLVEKRAEELLGLQHDRLFRASSRAICPKGRATKCASRYGGCTLPASRSFLTSSTITLPKAASSGRPVVSWARQCQLLPACARTIARHCINDTGTGNTLNLSHPRVLQMVMDSLRYWVSSFHVDGFRFDLGVTLGREPNGSIPVPAFSTPCARIPF